jgi:hypothetical protein
MSADTSTPAPPARWTVPEKLTRAQEITNLETDGLVYWARDAGIPGGYVGRAVKNWAVITLAEHYRSLPPADPPEADAAMFADLKAAADAVKAEADKNAFAPVEPYHHQPESPGAKQD